MPAKSEKNQIRFPTRWDDFVTWDLPRIILIAVVVGLFFAAGPILQFFDDLAYNGSVANAATPEEFNQEFFTWSYGEGRGIEFACNYAQGYISRTDGLCHDSEGPRFP